MIKNTHSFVTDKFVNVTIGFYTDDYILIEEQSKWYPIYRKKSQNKTSNKDVYLGVRYDEFGNEAGW